MSNLLISILTGLGGMFGYGASDFLASQVTRRIGNIKTIFWEQFIAVFVIGAVLLFVPVDFHFELILLPLGILLAIVYMVAFGTYYKGFEVGNVSVISPIVNSYAWISVLIAHFLFNQRLEGLQIAGIILIVLGVVLVSVQLDKIKTKKVLLVKGLPYALVASLAFGIVPPLYEQIVERMDFLFASFLSTVIASILVFVYSRIMRIKLGLKKEGGKTQLQLFIIAVLTLFATVSVGYGYSVGDSIIVAPVSSGLTVVTVVLAVVFLKERLKLNQIIGIIITVGGIVLTGLA
ncbi:MAG TPA: EamA family transporter [bacterium]|nr:EamA family transporter [bacterium]